MGTAPEQAAAIALWHLEFHQPPPLMVADLGPPAGPGHSLQALRLMVDPTLPRFYTVAAVHLRDAPGLPTANKALDHFTHELIVHTLEGVQPFDTPTPWALLQPHNLSVQWEDTSDEAAAETVRMVVLGVLHGQLPPEVQAYVPELHKMQTVLQLHQQWEDTVRATAEHAKTGGTHDLGDG
jgi:hypothetical protein